jgi:hypothetical protein
MEVVAGLALIMELVGSPRTTMPPLTPLPSETGQCENRILQNSIKVPIAFNTSGIDRDQIGIRTFRSASNNVT